MGVPLGPGSPKREALVFRRGFIVGMIECVDEELGVFHFLRQIVRFERGMSRGYFMLALSYLDEDTFVSTVPPLFLLKCSIQNFLCF